MTPSPVFEGCSVLNKLRTAYFRVHPPSGQLAMDLLLATIAAAGSIVPLSLFLRRTQGSMLLSRKAKVLNRYYDALEEAAIIMWCSVRTTQSEFAKSAGRLE